MIAKRLQPFPVALLAAAGVVFYTAQAADPPDSEQVSALLRDIRAQANMLSQDASTMEGYTRSGGSWQIHAAAVEQMRTHINETGRLLTRLQELRKSASPWQATAMDRIEPVLREMAANTEFIIKYLNDNPQRLSMDVYKEHIEANADVSAKMASLISDFIDYGNSKRRMEQLASKLELSKR